MAEHDRAYVDLLEQGERKGGDQAPADGRSALFWEYRKGGTKGPPARRQAECETHRFSTQECDE
jgi:hypothetical protein